MKAIMSSSNGVSTKCCPGSFDHFRQHVPESVQIKRVTLFVHLESDGVLVVRSRIPLRILACYHYTLDSQTLLSELSNEVGFPVTNTSFDALLESLLSTAKPFPQSAGYQILAS
ncbi:hypothetical protein Tco_0623303 [Tanacetum coccineum]